MLVSNLKKINTLIEDKKVFIFDFDGVIADSNDIKTKAFSDLYKSYGSEVVHKVALHHKTHGGLSRYEKFKYYHRSFLGKDIDQKQVNQMSEEFSALVLKKVIAAPEIFSAEAFLKKSCKNKKKCFVNSATPETEIKEIIKYRNLEKYFSQVFGSPSSKSDNILKILQYSEFNNKEALFFGDSESDLNAANKNRVSFIGVGRHILKFLIKSNEMNYHINDFSQISK